MSEACEDRDGRAGGATSMEYVCLLRGVMNTLRALRYDRINIRLFTQHPMPLQRDLRTRLPRTRLTWG